MATYFCSDLHGEYELFCRLLDKIKISGGDVIFVLGDFIDKGKDSIRLAKLLMNLKGTRVILGNHEHFFLQHYAYCADRFSLGEIDDIWKAVAEPFHTDDTSDLPEIADFIESLPCYIEEKDFICVHAGVELDQNNRVIPMINQDRNVMLFDREFKDDTVLPKDSKTVLFGHTPCSYSNGSGHFIKTLKMGISRGERLSDYAKIRLDTGASHTGVMGCLRKEDMIEFYTK